VANEADLVGAIDQGTTGTRFMLFDHDGAPVASAYKEHRQIYPQPGWVEHDADEIWDNTLEVMARAVRENDIDPHRIAAIGVTNQRETTVVWDDNGRPVHNAIVWQDRRTADRCRELAAEHGDEVRAKTGLPIDPYFSATKLEWLLDNVPGMRKRVPKGHIKFGTMDTWLLHNLAMAEHETDPTNASRTLLYNLHTMAWDQGLLELFRVPFEVLPAPLTSSCVFGYFEPCHELEDAWGPWGIAELRIPVTGDLGDQQAALFGQACYDSGDTKVTVGTGSFLLRHTGNEPVASRNGLLTTVAYALPDQPPCYALEGSVFITGAAVQWLRDGLGIIANAAETQALAESVPDTAGVHFVPAFAGLGAPYWDPYARGAITGLTGGATRAHLARATLEAIAYQTRDVIEAMAADAHASATTHALRMDGGAVKNDFLCQFQADILGVPVVRPAVEETTALGAAYAAGLAVGFWRDLDEIRRLWRPGRTFEPRLTEDHREALYAAWQRAVQTARSATSPPAT